MNAQISEDALECASEPSLTKFSVSLRGLYRPASFSVSIYYLLLVSHLCTPVYRVVSYEHYSKIPTSRLSSEVYDYLCPPPAPFVLIPAIVYVIGGEGKP